MKSDELLALIKNRRSIRKWSDKPVEEKKVGEILTAGVYAPSACNSQKTKFYVIREEESIAEITKNSPPHFYKNCPGVIIAVLFDLDKPHPLGFNFKKFHPFSRFIWQDTACAMMNMMLMAESLDLKTCWVTVSPPEYGDSERKIRNLLNIPHRFALASLLFLGYGDEFVDINTATHYRVPIKRDENEAILMNFDKSQLKSFPKMKSVEVSFFKKLFKFRRQK